MIIDEPGLINDGLDDQQAVIPKDGYRVTSWFILSDRRFTMIWFMWVDDAWLYE